MIVIRKKENSTYIPYTINGNIININNELMLNLLKYERDDPNHIDICQDKFGCLVCGTAAGFKYVAEIDIPERQYIEIEEEPDAEGHPSMIEQPVDFDINLCTITLWSLEE